MLPIIREAQKAGAPTLRQIADALKRAGAMVRPRASQTSCVRAWKVPMSADLARARLRS
jgi:hypothetical protein